jgi:hypothetical protein
MLGLLLAQVGVDHLDRTPMTRHTNKIFGLNIRDALLIFGAGVALTLLLFLWAYLTRKKHRRSQFGSPILVKADKHGHPGKHRVRRRRRGHPANLPRNPTLGETGGLPPVRPEEPTEPTQ